MAIATTERPAHTLPGATVSEPAKEGFADDAQSAWRALRGALHERVRLLTLEARLAGLTFVQLVLYAVIVAVLVVTSWIGLMGGIVAGLVSAGMHWAVGLAIGIALNLAAAYWLVRSMLAMLGRLDLEATLRRLQGDLKSRSE